MKKSIVLAALAAFAFASLAAPADGAPPADCEGIKVATGPKGKGFSLLFADVAKVCGAKVNLCEVTTAGGLDNLTSLSTKEADVGFVQVDTWTDMKNGDDNIAALQSILPVNNNYLHVITSSAGFIIQGEKKFGGFMGGKAQPVVINRFSELRGKPVALVGSAQLLGRRLDKQFGYGMQFVDSKDDGTAFEMVKKGQVAAAFTVSGWPSGTVKTLTQSSGLTMVPFDAPIGEPYKVKALNYKNIAVYNNNSLAVQNVFVTRQFSGQRAANISALQTCIMQNMSELKEGQYQPGWNEVNVNASTGGMTPFKATKK
jgi:TRAP-type uncharacterized transport system substrate-binding protein